MLTQAEPSQLCDKQKVRGSVEIRRRKPGEEWKTVQVVKNTVTTYGKEQFADLSRQSGGVISQFEVGAGGRETIDISNPTGTTVFKWGYEDVTQLAQSFYATTGNVARVVLKNAGQSGTPLNDWTAELYDASGTAYANPVSGVEPTGAALVTKYYRSTMLDDLSGTEFSVDFSAAQTKAGSRYVAVFALSGTDNYSGGAYQFVTGSNTDNFYSSGTMLVKSGTDWTSRVSEDLYFKTYYATDDGAPVAKSASSNTHLIPISTHAISSSSRTNSTASFVCDLTTIQGNIPGVISEFRVMQTSTGSAIATVAFRDESKDELSEMQIVWNLQMV